MTMGDEVNGIVARTSRTSRPSWWNLLVVLPWTIGLVLIIFETRINTQIAERQRTTSGIITAHEPGNHNQYGYRFEVDTKSYMGWQSPKDNELAIGKTVTVYYDPHDPRKNALTDFHEVATLGMGPAPMLLFGIGAVVLLIFYGRRRRSRSTESERRN